MEQGDIDIAVHWVLARPGIFLTTAGDIHLLPKMLDAASRFDAAPYDEALRELTARLEADSAFRLNLSRVFHRFC